MNLLVQDSLHRANRRPAVVLFAYKFPSWECELSVSRGAPSPRLTYELFISVVCNCRLDNFCITNASNINRIVYFICFNSECRSGFIMVI